MIQLNLFLDQPWEQARGYLREDLDHIQAAFNQHLTATVADGTTSVWGHITGTLSSQVDLTAALATKESLTNKNAPSGYAGLNGSSKLTGSQQVYGTTANTAAEGNDARFSAIGITAAIVAARVACRC